MSATKSHHHDQIEKESRHTKGEWRYDKRDDPENSTIPFSITAPRRPSAVIPIADICAFPPNSKEELQTMEANAKRIVKAVNMHEDLMEIVKWIGDIILTAKDGGDAWCAVRNQPGAKEWFDKINSVLKQAEEK